MAVQRIKRRLRGTVTPLTKQYAYHKSKVDVTNYCLILSISQP